MTIPSAIVVFSIVWWISFFILLPQGIRSHGDASDEDYVVGQDPGAPNNPRLKRKALIASLAAIIITGTFVLASELGGFTLRGLFR